MYVYKHAYKRYFLEALIFIWQYTVLTYLLNIYAVKFWLPICAVLGYPVVIMTLVMPLVWDTLQFMGARKVLLDWWTFQTSHLYDLWFQKVFLNFDKKKAWVYKRLHISIFYFKFTVQTYQTDKECSLTCLIFDIWIN